MISGTTIFQKFVFLQAIPTSPSEHLLDRLVSPNQGLDRWLPYAFYVSLSGEWALFLNWLIFDLSPTLSLSFTSTDSESLTR
jgi:hypothetical protein